MVDLTLLELHFPEARFIAEAEFNAPFAGHGSADAGDAPEGGADSPAARSPPVAPLVVAGVLTIVALVMLRRGWKHP